MRHAFIASVALVLSPCLASAQTGGTSHTTGSCSPAVAGANNQITITCTGVGVQKTDQLIRLMNQILARQLDLNQVYAELTQLHTDISKLDLAIQPIANAPPAAAALIKESQSLATVCSNFSADWQRLLIEKQGEVTSSALSTLDQQQESSSTLAHNEIADFQQSLTPQLKTYLATIQRYVPTAHAYRDYSAPKSASDVQWIGLEMKMLLRSYLQQPMATAHVDSSIVSKGQALERACYDFAQTWKQADGTTSQTVTSASLHIQERTSQDGVNAQQISRYRMSLQPRLSAWHLKIAPLVKEIAPPSDFSSVTSPMQLSEVCQSIVQVTNVYRDEVIEDLVKRRTPPTIH